MTGDEKSPKKAFGPFLAKALVVAVVVILFLLLILPAMSVVDGNRIDPARSAITLLHQALACYELDFGHPASWADKETDYEVDNASLIQALTSDVKTGPYLDVRTREMRDGVYIERWGRPYHIAVDANEDGEIAINGTTVAATFAIWSDGPNQFDERGQGDDITTW